MTIDVQYKYSQRGIISENFIEEACHCLDVETAIDKIGACLRHLKKNGDGAIHVSINGRTLSVFTNSYDDWENGIISYCESEERNISTKKNISFSKVKKLFRNWIDVNAVAAA